MTSLDQVAGLADLLATIRPSWDKIATQNQLLPYKHLPYELLAYVAIRCALDPANRTPASLKWMDTAPPEQVEREDFRGRKEPACVICGRSHSRCRAQRDKEIQRGIPDTHEFESAEDAEHGAAVKQIDPENPDARVRAVTRRPPDDPWLPEDLAAESQARLELDQHRGEQPEETADA